MRTKCVGRTVGVSTSLLTVACCEAKKRCAPVRGAWGTQGHSASADPLKVIVLLLRRFLRSDARRLKFLYHGRRSQFLEHGAPLSFLMETMAYVARTRNDWSLQVGKSVFWNSEIIRYGEHHNYHRHHHHHHHHHQHIQELQASNEALCLCTKFLDESSMAVDLGQRL